MSLNKSTFLNCGSFGWGRFNFLPSGCYGAVFWIYAEHRIDNTDVFVIAEQCLHRVRAFSAFSFPVKLSLSQPTNFQAFTLPIHSLIPTGGRRGEQVPGLWRLPGVKP